MVILRCFVIPLMVSKCFIDSFQDWFSTLPIFTRYWFGATIAFTLLGRFGILAANWLVLAWYPLVHQFQVRPNNELTQLNPLFSF